MHQPTICILHSIPLGKAKKKLKQMMHVKSGDQSSKIIKKKSPKLIKVLSNPASMPARSKNVNNLSKTSAIARAEEVISSLNPNCPTFVKLMVRSHVSSCFWMGLSSQFCKLHLPKKDMLITVEDESGQEFEMIYIFQRTALSGGWKFFAVAQKLLEDDVVIFQLVKPLEPIKLKVYIIRASDAASKDGATINLDSHKQQNDAENSCPETNLRPLPQYTTKRKKFMSLQGDTLKKKKKTGLGKSVSKISKFEDKTKYSDEESDLEIIGASSNPPSQVQFKDVKIFEDFTIIVDGLLIDSELPNHIRHKYYKLCSARKAYLHARLMPGLNSKLIAGIISETVNIADLVTKGTLTTCSSEFANWERALKSFHFMGMSVGFIITRMRTAVKCAFESKDAVESRKYMVAKPERDRAEEELANLESKLDELEESYKKCGDDVNPLKEKAEKFAQKFQEEVDAPW